MGSDGSVVTTGGGGATRSARSAVETLLACHSQYVQWAAEARESVPTSPAVIDTGAALPTADGALDSGETCEWVSAPNVLRNT